MSDKYEPRLKTQYREKIRAKLKEQFQYGNEMQVPKLDKVAVSYTHLTLPTKA